MNFDLSKLKPAFVEFGAGKIESNKAFKGLVLIHQLPGGIYLFKMPEMKKNQVFECTKDKVLTITWLD